VKRVVALAPLAALLAIVVAAIVILRAGEQAPVQEGLIGKPAPTYALAPLAGETTVTPEAFAGRPYVINFFASWCAPCRLEHPMLLELAKEGVPILGVAYKDEPTKTARMLALSGDPFQAVGMDPTGRFALELGITGVPETYVVDAEGKLSVLHRSVLTAEVVENEIRPALGLPPR
jgi:cytochrome c biogenesis protein CcmG, thiol:disulfide interchange protein DsbE